MPSCQFLARVFTKIKGMRNMFHRTRNIFLVGLPGAGKSTVGRQLARTLKMDFYDTDDEIEKRCGADIAWIFDIEGEEGFYEREEALIQELTESQGIILATGGGTVLSEKNRARLSARGSVVYLKTSIDQQLERTLYDKKRPMLQTGNKRETLEGIKKEREELYESVADVMVDTVDRGIRSVINDIMKQLDALVE